MKRFLCVFAALMMMIPLNSCQKEEQEVSATPAPTPSDPTRINFSINRAEKTRVDCTVFVGEGFDANDGLYKPFFPTIAQTEDGSLVAVFYYSKKHAYYRSEEGRLHGVLMITRSEDLGKTWSEAEVLVDLSEGGKYNREARDPNLHRFADGTLLLTYPAREQLDFMTSMGDYWHSRTYYRTSTDGGLTWGEEGMIPCVALDGGDFPAGCWAKNGSVAEWGDGDFALSVYGGVDCTTRANWQSFVIFGKNEGDGRISWDTEREVRLQGVGQDANETALWASPDGQEMYAFLRSSAATGGKVYRSTDYGRTFAPYAVQESENGWVNQPGLLPLSDGRILATYSVPLGSAPKVRDGRPIYAKLFEPGEDFHKYESVLIYDSTVNDMADPTTIQLFDGRFATIFYDVSKSVIGVNFTELYEYDPALPAPQTQTLWDLTLPKSLTLKAGEERCVMIGSDRESETVKLSAYVSDTSLLSLSEDGVLKALGTGEATLFVRVRDTWAQIQVTIA